MPIRVVDVYKDRDPYPYQSKGWVFKDYKRNKSAAMEIARRFSSMRKDVIVLRVDFGTGLYWQIWVKEL